MKKKPTKAMQEYSEIDLTLKNLTKRKQELRSEIIDDLLKDPDGFEGLNLSKKQVITWIDDEFYNWVATEFPEVVDLATKKTIDYEKFEELVKTGKISYTDIPENVYKSRTDYMISILKNRKR